MVERQPSDTAQLKIRVKESVRQQLEDAARENDWTLNREIARRLEESLREDRAHGSRRTTAFVQQIAAAIALIEADTDADWHADEDTFLAVKGAIEALLVRLDPGFGTPEMKQISELQALSTAKQEAYEFARKALDNYRINELGWTVGSVDVQRRPRGMFGRASRATLAEPPASPPIGWGLLSGADIDPQKKVTDDRLNAEMLSALDEWQAANSEAIAAISARETRRKRGEQAGHAIGLRLLGLSTPLESHPTDSEQ
ncbi:MAG: Arc family DNA-binding protein [Rhizorhabdus sp.]|uniref:Arc family DNA-binding protein n=1 Tax=Rhizorhabdus sp. TaxID=1968843 RepID=UPI001B7B95FB|nr:Arc family DNA-binding protein [Rhizorhabdus sp.]MBP8235171.1 Arc family DNA-binding protein [Rhizorhabdus sp.]